MGRRTGQTSMILMVFIILIMMALGVFFLISTIESPPSEYENLYVHNLLLSVLRKDTGYRNPCSTISETISSVVMTSGMSCGGKSNVEVLDEIMKPTIETILAEKPKYDYFIRIQPENYDIAGGTTKSYGNPDLLNREMKWVANEKILQYESNIRVMLVLAEA
jgi:hypothetical protein